jgi:hypothetical protein
MNTIQEKWEAARNVLLPRNPGKHQARDMQHAFYAGAMSVLTLLGSIPPGASPEVTGAMIAGWHEEIEAYAKGMRP